MAPETNSFPQEDCPVYCRDFSSEGEFCYVRCPDGRIYDSSLTKELSEKISGRGDENLETMALLGARPSEYSSCSGCGIAPVKGTAGALLLGAILVSVVVRWLYGKK